MRLVDVWEMRKVLRSHGMAAVKSHLDKVKDTIAPSSPSNGHSESVQGNKRKRDTHPIVDATETVEIVAKQRLETEHAILHLMKEVRRLFTFCLWDGFGFLEGIGTVDERGIDEAS